MGFKISWIDGDDRHFGLSCCPGMQSYRTSISRDLQQDLQGMVRAGIRCVVCLLNDAELRCLKVSNYDSGCRQHGIEFIQFPIIEGAAPESLAATMELVDTIATKVSKGEAVLVHCRAGVGRAGCIAACVMLKLGVCADAKQAIQYIREKRNPKAIETRRQEDFVALYKKNLQ